MTNEAATYQIGVNLGGWLSQYGQASQEHFQTFITEEDIRRIAGWGMDHIRLPVDYPILEDDARPFTYLESGFGYIDSCLEWCKNNRMKVILDLHKAPGYVFDNYQAASLFQDARLQERFVALWRFIAERYQGRQNLVFELLNEITLPDSRPWNELYQRTLAVIRQVDPDRLVLVGGNRYNSPDALKELVLADDPNVFYTFHFYHPMIFTHQKASWVPIMKEFNQTVEYPSLTRVPSEIVQKHFGQNALGSVIEMPANLDEMRKALQPALDFRSSTGKTIYCGEYGAIEVAPLASRIRWHQDFIQLLKENHIGRAVWSYKQMDFSLVDAKGNIVSQELVKVISQ